MAVTASGRNISLFGAGWTVFHGPCLDDYRNLIVRVAGYSDYFCDLGRELQDEIIGPTGHQGF